MKQQERFLESELMAAVVTSMLTAFIESNDEKVDDPLLDNVPEEERNRRGITDTLLRLSVGIENSEDLIQDLKEALA